MESLHISSSETPKSRDVATLLRQLAAKGSNFVDGNSKSRGELLEIARSLCIALETPMEAILRMGWAQVTSVVLFVAENFAQYLTALLVANSRSGGSYCP